MENGKLIVLDFVINQEEFETRLTVKDNVSGAALPDNTAVIILDTNLTPELIAEGLANDALRFIQDTRKTMDLNVSDRIKITYNADSELSNAIEAHRARIMENALIVEMKRGFDTVFNTIIEGQEFSIKIDN